MNKKRNAFTLVELLAVIVILAIILVIAVPKVISIIKDAKKGTLETTAKMIASAAEKKKMENAILESDEKIECEDVAKLNDIDYADCDIYFDGNTALVTIIGSEKFEGLYVCDGTKSNSEATEEGCSPKAVSIDVQYPTFYAGQEISPDDFIVTATYRDGTTRVLENGTRMEIPEGIEETTITSPNWPENYPDNMTESKNYWLEMFEGATAIQITFDETSETESSYDYIRLYDKDGNKVSLDFNGNTVNNLGGTSVAGKTYTILGDSIKITMKSNSSTNKKGFSAVIKPLYKVDAEYLVSRSEAPVSGDFDIIVSVNGQSVSKKIIGKIANKGAEYISSSVDTIQTTAIVNGETVDAGARYVGPTYGQDAVKNRIYFNCNDEDASGEKNGSENYNYASNCEIWRIIGVFDTYSSETDTIGAKRIKIVRDAFSTGMAWDSSASNINFGCGINQWGEIKDGETIIYEGADLMRLLNGYYIRETDTCKYCSGGPYEYCSSDCASSVNQLSITSLEMVDDVLWYTGSPTYLENLSLLSMYEGERSAQGGKICGSRNECNDNIARTTTWIGKIGLIYPSDYAYASTNEGCSKDIVSNTICNEKNWLRPYNIGFYWTITPRAYRENAHHAWAVNSTGALSANFLSNGSYVRPSLYLKPDIQIIGGDGTDNSPYRLSAGVQ